jgi:hypothetical protein
MDQFFSFKTPPVNQLHVPFTPSELSAANPQLDANTFHPGLNVLSSAVLPLSITGTAGPVGWNLWPLRN